MQTGVVPRIPAPWTATYGRRARFDLARGALADGWSRHPILGDPSYDTFVRDGDGPFVRGSAPFRWPVNGFLFEDPMDGAWYAYVGYYLEGYDLGPGRPATHCRIHRSRDQGRTWVELGPLFTDPSFRFDGDPHATNIAPDVSVVHDRGRYVLAYDWVHDEASWATIGRPGPGSDSGVGIAVAERPEGPWTRLPRPVLRASDFQRRLGNSLRYRRPYASSLIRRKRDWLILTDVDSGPCFAWGQIAMTAATPDGPWSEPTRVVDLEGDTWYPAPIEAFPAFVHRGFVYDPRTSVGRNRNHQTLWRAPVESAHRADAWELHQAGSLWHAEPTADEGFGIWGQTLAGFVDRTGIHHVLFPSRATPGGEGTIRTAARPWNRPMRERGFVLSGHGGASTTWTRFAVDAFRLRIRWRRKGGGVRVSWGGSAMLGGAGRADGVPHPLVGAGGIALLVDDAGHRLVRGAGAPREVLAEAAGPSPGAIEEFVVERQSSGSISLRVSERETLRFQGPPGATCLGLHVDPGTHLEVERFEVEGKPSAAEWIHLWPEAIAGAGVDEAEVGACKESTFRFGEGADTLAARVKWNFRGTGYRLWLPRGPRWGEVELRIDGVPAGKLDLHSPSAVPSAVLHERRGLADGHHALTVRCRAGRMPVDCLEALLGPATRRP